MEILWDAQHLVGIFHTVCKGDIMKEIFVIYNKNTGFIGGGTGMIDRDLDLISADGSTMLERIPEILAKDPDRKVAYLSYRPVPDSAKHKIDTGGNLVQLTETEKTTINQTKIDEEKIQDEITTIARAEAVQNLKDKGELPIDYVDVEIGG